MSKEPVILKFISVLLLVSVGIFSLPQIGMLISVMGVIALVATPLAILVVLIVPSFRTRFLSA